MHRHDMNMEFPQPDSLACIYACACGLTTTDGNEALSWQGKTSPQPPVRPMGVEEAERRRIEKLSLFAARYGTSGATILADLERMEQARTSGKTWWQRLVAWWRYDFAQTHHKGCGGVWVEAGTSGFAVLRVHLVCSRCHEESYILHSPGM